MVKKKIGANDEKTLEHETGRDSVDCLVSPVCGFPGVGKSYVANLHRWPDSDSSAFSKGEEWPANYIAHLRGLRGPVMVSTHAEVRDALYEAGIPYTLCYPDRIIKAEYLERYRKRGSPEAFCVLLDENWDSWIIALEQDTRAQKHVILKAGQYVSDIDLENTKLKDEA